MNYGKAITEVREKLNLTPFDFASKIGISEKVLLVLESSPESPGTYLCHAIEETFNLGNAFLTIYAVEADKDMSPENKSLFDKLFPGFHDKLTEFIGLPEETEEHPVPVAEDRGIVDDWRANDSYAMQRDRQFEISAKVQLMSIAADLKKSSTVNTGEKTVIDLYKDMLSAIGL